MFNFHQRYCQRLFSFDIICIIWSYLLSLRSELFVFRKFCDFSVWFFSQFETFVFGWLLTRMKRTTRRRWRGIRRRIRRWGRRQWRRRERRRRRRWRQEKQMNIQYRDSRVCHSKRFEFQFIGEKEREEILWWIASSIARRHLSAITIIMTVSFSTFYEIFRRI